MLKNCQLVFPHFSFGPPWETMKKKVVLLSSNFERLHEIINEAYAENFSCLSHWEPKKSRISENPVHNLTEYWRT